MATRLSKAEGFSGLWKELIIRSNYNFYNTTLEKVKRADKMLNRQLRKAYGDFFVNVARNFINRYSGTRTGPTPVAGWGAWTPLSQDWLNEKASHDGVTNRFYSGLTGAGTSVKDGKGGFKHVNLGESFEEFMRSLKPVDVDDAFGALVIEYTFRTKGKKYTTQDIQGVTDLAQQINQSRNEDFPEQLMITAEVRAFQNLRGTPMKEWEIVDKIISEMGSYEQWRKINGTRFGRNARPIRPLIGPNITRFMNDVSLKALQQFNESLR